MISMAQNVGNDEHDYSEAVEVLSKMFHPMMEKDAIYAIVDSYDGNVSHSIDAIVSVLNDGNVLMSPAAPSIDNVKIPTKSEDNLLTNQNSSLCAEQSTEIQHNFVAELSEEQCVINVPSYCNTVPQVHQSDSVSSPIETESTKSYATMSKATGAIPKQATDSTKVQGKPGHSDQMQRIIDYHQKGYKVLVIMRGPPGCGKSYLARQIVGNTIGHEQIMYKTHICSTDDFFCLRGRYIYDRDQLSEAHDWNQNRVRSIVQQGISPVVIDNTNIELWETQPYVRAGLAEGYYIEVAEPQTPWARNAYQLTKKNSHNVPFIKIKKMLDNFQRNVSGELLIKILGYSYPANKVPPVLRKIPKIHPENKPTEKSNEQVSTTSIKQNKLNQLPPTSKDTQSKPTQIEKPLNQANINENWDVVSNSNSRKCETVAYDPKPQRNKKQQEQLLRSLNEDWTKITDFMPPWHSTPPATLVKKIEKDKADTNSRGTCVEYGDADVNNVNIKYRVLTGTPQNINLYHMPKELRIPDSIMLDKSTMTNEHLITEAHQCKNVEKHFREFRKMFKNIAAADLREIFDKCHCDVNWAVEIVLDGVASNQFETAEEVSSSDTDELENELCECTAAYDIIPQVSSNSETEPKPVEDLVQQVQKRKIKKVIKPGLSDSAIELKKQFEQNMVIPDNHYSQHCLKIKKWRHGELENAETARGYIPDTPEGNASLINDDYFNSTSKSNVEIQSAIARTKRDRKSTSESSEEESESSDYTEETVTVNIGTEFIKQLDTLFGRDGTTYPSDVLPLVSIPMSLVTTINALWIESLTYQLDMQANYSHIMLKHDEELARALAIKDMEIFHEDREPDVPDFKQIMDMDLALSLHQKDVANWKNNQPNDWAAKMTRAKLHNLFPDVPQETLSELLVAHDNNFQETVEGLLVSTGQASVLDTENGINKFVMTREIARQVSFLESERNRVLAESKEWLLKLESEDASLETIEGYRQWSQDLKVKCDLCVEHANTFLQRGVREMAQRCSETAQFYSTQFDMAKNIAVTAYIRINGKRVTGERTIDLHFLHVKEAMHALDIFVDENIHLLRSGEQVRGSGDDNFLYVITGRGLHSDGGAKIKPAAKKRLKQRGFKVKDKNPGLIFFEYSKVSKMSHELDAK